MAPAALRRQDCAGEHPATTAGPTPPAGTGPRATVEHVLAERRATLVPAGAIDMVRAAFDAVNPLLHPPFAAEAPAADVGGAQPEGA